MCCQPLGLYVVDLSEVEHTSSVFCFDQERSELQKQSVCDKFQQVFSILELKQKVCFSVDPQCEGSSQWGVCYVYICRRSECT